MFDYKHIKPPIAFFSTLLLGLGTQYAVGAEKEDADALANTISMEEVVVTGVRGSIVRALDQKRNSIGVVDAISAEDLGKFPDLNLSESIARVPGVTLERGPGGEGRAVNLRGLNPNFTRVEINGMTGPGSSAGGRGFNFEILPSELFSNVTVEKTAQAKQAEGGLSGVISLETPKPFDYKGFKLSTSAQGNYSKNADDIGSRFSLLVSNNFDDVFGVAASIVQTETQFQAFQVGGMNTRPFSSVVRKDPITREPVTGTPEELASQVTNVEHFIHDAQSKESTSASIAFQWRPTDDLEITVDGLYSTLDADRFYTRADAPSESNITSISNSVIENGLITSVTLGPVQQRLGVNDASSEEDLTQLVLRADWTPNDSWTVSPFLGLTKRKIDRTGNLFSFRRADLSTGDFVQGDVTYSYRGDFVDWTTTGTNFSENPEEFLLNVFLLKPSKNTDEDLTTKVDFQWKSEGGALSMVDFGIRYSDREITSVASDTRIVAEAGFDRRLLPSLGDALSVLDNFNVDGSASSVPNSIMGVNTSRILELYAPNGLDGTPVTGALIVPRPLTTARRSYDVQEKNFNAYAQATFEIDKLTLNMGLRYLNTEQISAGFSIVNNTPFPISNTTRYWDVLPSASMRYELQENMYLRAAYSKSLTRPSLANIAPTENVNGVDEGGGTGSQGNPGLTPFTADNIDIGAEWYFADEALVAATLFFKQIDGIIDTSTFEEDRTFPRQSDNALVTAPILFTRPTNGVTASIKGLELSFQTPFSIFSPEVAILNNFGVIFNYTFTESSASYSDEGDVRSAGLPGLSENSFNSSFYYDDGRFDARVSYAWRDAYLNQFSGAWGIPRFQEAYGQLDLSANYRITDNVVLQFQGLNLTSEQAVYQSDNGGVRAPNAVNQLDRRIIFGVRYSL